MITCIYSQGHWEPDRDRAAEVCLCASKRAANALVRKVASVSNRETGFKARRANSLIYSFWRFCPSTFSQVAGNGAQPCIAG